MKSDKLRKSSKLLGGRPKPRIRREKYKSFVGGLADSVRNNSKKFWTFFRATTQSHSIPSHISHDGKAAETSLAQAEMFNRYFHSVFVKSGNAPELLPDITECCIPELANIQFDH